MVQMSVHRLAAGATAWQVVQTHCVGIRRKSSAPVLSFRYAEIEMPVGYEYEEDGEKWKTLPLSSVLNRQDILGAWQE